MRPAQSTTHAAVGAGKVRPLLGPRVAWLVANHVAAKRYLVTTDPTYRSRLSEGSIRSLTAQGDELGPRGVAALDAHVGLEALLALRRADDDAKVPGAVVPDLDTWVPVLAAVSRSLAVGRK